MAEITCKHYFPIQGSKRCRSFLRNGACNRPDYFMCVEWEKGKKRQADESARRISAERRAEFEADEARDRDYIPSEQDIQSLTKTGAVIKLSVGEEDEIYIVPEYTGQDRNELTVEHACAVAMVVRAFPDARIAGFWRES